jgi:hypothetical protein
MTGKVFDFAALKLVKSIACGRISVQWQGSFFPCRALWQGIGWEGRGKNDIVDSVVCFGYVLIWVPGPSTQFSYFRQSVLSVSPVGPAQPVMMAGDPQWNNATKRMREGIPVPTGLLNQLRQIAQVSAASWLLG